MTPLHLNLGRLFARTYESDYSLLRRVLIANPGIGPSTLNRLLKSQEAGRSLYDRLRRLDGTPPSQGTRSGWAQTYRRQCPECALRFYHSDLFALPWIARCPIHNCDLTEHCPLCDRPWPAPPELARRHCPGCGVPLLKEMIRPFVFETVPDRYQLIGRIYEYVDQGTENELELLAFADLNNWRRYMPMWYRRVSPQDPEFPAFQTACYPELALPPLPDRRHNAQMALQKPTALSPVDESDAPPGYIEPGSPKYRLEQEKLPLLRQEYIVLKRLVQWIDKRADPTHRVFISNYRRMNTDALYSMATICPFCMALSLWLFGVISRKQLYNAWDQAPSYPFCIENGVTEFLDVPYVDCVWHSEGGYFLTTPTFSQWFYRRGLEVSFLLFFRFAEGFLDLVEEPQAALEQAGTSHRDPSHFLSAQYYKARLTADQLTVCYMPQRALTHARPHVLSIMESRACHDPRFEMDSFWREDTFSVPVDANLTFKQFCHLLDSVAGLPSLTGYEDYPRMPEGLADYD